MAAQILSDAIDQVVLQQEESLNGFSDRLVLTSLKEEEEENSFVDISTDQTNDDDDDDVSHQTNTTTAEPLPTNKQINEQSNVTPQPKVDDIQSVVTAITPSTNNIITSTHTNITHNATHTTNAAHKPQSHLPTTVRIPSASYLAAALQDQHLKPTVKLQLLCTRLATNPPEETTENNRLKDNILHLMVSEDLQRIQHGDCVRAFFARHICSLPVRPVAELLGILIAVLKKSWLNLESCKGILLHCVQIYTGPEPTDNLIKHFLFEIAAIMCGHSCSVKELRHLLVAAANDGRFLQLIRDAHLQQKGRPTAFFALPGQCGSIISLPPLSRWPTAHGWTFVCWFRLEPATGPSSAQPHLFHFRTSKSGLGYSAHFAGNCLVLSSVRQKGRGQQHCVPYEFAARRWYHCAIAYMRGWRSSEVKVYVNGQLTCGHEMPWTVQTAEAFDRCCIGGTPDPAAHQQLFCGQLSAIYLFQEPLSAAQVCAVHRLGPSYMGQYRHVNETTHSLPPAMRRTLYEKEKLSSALFSLYTPVAVERDRLCLQCAPVAESGGSSGGGAGGGSVGGGSSSTYFCGTAHAALLGDAAAICTWSVSSTLQSIGGIRALLPLLAKFSAGATSGNNADHPSLDAGACSTLIGFICDLLESWPTHWFGNEAVQSHAFVIIASLLSKHARQLINEQTLDTLLSLSRTLMSAAASDSDSLLLKQLMDSVLFNPSLWIYADARLQLKLYAYLASEFLVAGDTLPPSNGNNSAGTGSFVFSEVRRISTVLQLLHSLKYYYWLVPEEDHPHFSSHHPLHQQPSQHLINSLAGDSTTNAVDSQSVASELSKLIELGVHLPDVTLAGGGGEGVANLATTNLRPPAGGGALPAGFSAAGGGNIAPICVKARDSKRPGRSQLVAIRGHILQFIRQLILRGSGVHHDELQAMLNYLTTMFQDENLLDVLHTLQQLMAEQPASMIPAFDAKHGVRTVFKLLDSRSEPVRLAALRLLGYFLSRSTSKRKQDVMGPHNLSMLLYERLLKHTPLTLETYAALIEILVEQPCEQFTRSLLGNVRIENPMMLKVIAMLIIEGRPGHQPSQHLQQQQLKKEIEQRNLIRKLFINDLWKLLVNNRENCRLVLQMSVWQHWLINLIYDRNNLLLRDQILTIFRVLLHHAIKYEYGGWRVWIDTLAIIHAKVSWEEFLAQFGEQRPSSILPPLSQADVQPNEKEDVSATASSDTITKADKSSPIDPCVDQQEESVDDKNQESVMAQQQMVATICLEHQPSTDESDAAATRSYRKETIKTNKLPVEQPTTTSVISNVHRPPTATTTPAFRMPEFRWSALHIKLLNDLLFSIESDVQMWRVQGAKEAAGKDLSHHDEHPKMLMAAATASHLDQILQNPDNQIYIINAIHLVSQLCDNVILAAGGLLPLLAAATGGSGGSAALVGSTGGEGLSASQANQLVYRLANLADVLCFAATHVSFAELESEKSMNCGGILRQCLRLVCTVAVKNCLLIQQQQDDEINSTPASAQEMSRPIDGVSLAAAGKLFDDNDMVESDEEHGAFRNNDFVPFPVSHSSSPASLPPIRDACKLLQDLDVNRLRACIYRDPDADAKQTQFLALSTLYFISVLMVSKYRDIIEPKGKQRQLDALLQRELLHGSALGSVSSSSHQDEQHTRAGVDPASIGEILTARLETTLFCVCPLLREIMCDFSSFLSRTLLGSHGQDLVTKEAVRTFRRANASPVELVMLLCSQEWQNTLQKNAGLAFIELINDGRVLGQSMKEHIVRVATEAELIIDRLRADDVSKHELFAATCLETMSARAHEEGLIHSLISSAKRRDRMLFAKFRANLCQPMTTSTSRSSHPNGCPYRLDTWEDDSRRRRRFVLDTCAALQAETIRRNAQSGDPLTARSTESKPVQETQRVSAPFLIARPKESITAIHRHDPADEEEEDEEEDRYQTYYSQQQQPCWTDVEGGSDSFNAPGSPCAADLDEERPSGADYVDTLVASLECVLVWSIFSIEGTLQITASELMFEPAALSERTQESSHTAVDGSVFSRPNGNATSGHHRRRQETDSRTREALQALLGGGMNGNSNHASNHAIRAKNPLKDLDLNALRYCDLLANGGKISLSEVRAVFSRRYLLQPNALEIFLAQRTSVMFAFHDFDTVKRVVKHLPPVGVGVKYGIPQSRRASLMGPRQLFAASNMTARWQKREISNFEYLMFLNTIAGRTFQDLNQYPVFPWVLTNYDSAELDLCEPTNYRDLSKPVGALNGDRRQEFQERYQRWEPGCPVPPFHYGTHYSTAAFSLNWLIRLQPYQSAYLALQDGQYEDTGRLFTSVQDAWLSCLLGGQQNVKELIPEFFYLPEMFSGASGAELPFLKSVALPKWANSPQHFVRLHRLALESELVSCQLHQWIDLIFGYKQRGPEAVRAVNVFYYLTYEGAVDLSALQPCARQAIEAQIVHFGQTPAQLTTEPHPPRSSPLHVAPLMFSPVLEELCMAIKFPFNAPIVHVAACSLHSCAAAGSSVAGSGGGQLPTTIVTVNGAIGYHLHRWNAKEHPQQPFAADPTTLLSGSSAGGSSGSSGNLRRQLQDLSNFSSSESTSLQVIVTLDAKHLIVAPFFDNSFRVYSTETGKLVQIVYGHRAPVTCLARSECNVVADFYIASGSRDCSILLWTWNAKYGQVEGAVGGNNANPLPKLTLTGHESEVVSLLISAELGLIVSGSCNLILLHTTSGGDCICSIDVRCRTSPARSDCVLLAIDESMHNFNIDTKGAYPLVVSLSKY